MRDTSLALMVHLLTTLQNVIEVMLRSKLETPTDRNSLPEVETFPLETAAFRLATSLVHSSPIAAAAWWSSTNAETCNGAFRALTHNPEVWQAFHSLASASYRDGLPRIEENVLIPVGEQERYFTIAIYPLLENDSCGGVFGTFQDVTPAVLNAKRFDILRELKDQLQKAVSADEACQAGMAVFSRHSKDVPFALLYLFGQNDAQGQLVAAVGVEKQSAAIPERFWAMAAGVQIVEAPSWAESSQCAVVIPMSGRDTANQLGYLVAGMPKGQTRDERQKVFFSLIANSIAGALSSFRKKTTSEEVSEVLESITDGVVALDQNWIIRYVNREAERLSGMGREDLVGRTHWDVFPQRLAPNCTGIVCEYWQTRLLLSSNSFTLRGRDGFISKLIRHRTVDSLYFTKTSLNVRRPGKHCVRVRSAFVQLYR